MTRYIQVVDGVVHESAVFEENPGAPWIEADPAIGAGWLFQNGKFFVPVPAVVPSEITMQQARQVLNAAGLISAIDAKIDAMPEPQRSKAKIAWEYSNTVQRHFGLVSQLGPAIGLTDDQIDAMFIAGAQIQ